MSKWFIKNNNIDFKSYIESLDINPIIAKILANRGISSIEEAENFLYGDLKSMHNPEQMYDLVKACNIIKSNIDYNNSIRVIGDYDVDGIISTYVITSVLNDLGAIVDYEIPNRIEDGYGINKKIIKKAYDDNIKLIITCDNGIAAIDEVDYAKELGIEVIVTDHHDLAFIEDESGKREYILPKADAVVNPKNHDCEYPFKNLCGAGVAYKMLDYLSTKLYGRSDEDINKYLEYIAIATIADVVELKDENRIIVKYGLSLLNKTDNLGLKTLISELEINGNIGVYHIGFIIGPTLNASGRLDIADKGVELLKTDDSSLAESLSKELKLLNDDRKNMTEKGLENIINQIENLGNSDDILVVYDNSIHESIAGIIAGRVKDIYYKPTIILTDSDDGFIKGSARSIEEYNIFEGLTEHKNILSRFGGHPMAAGLSLEKENLELLRTRLNKSSKLTQDDLVKKYYIDYPLPMEYVNFDIIAEIDKLQPFGLGNPKPIFGDKKLKINRLYKLGKDRKILKFDLLSQSGNIIEGIMFNDIEKFEDEVIKVYGEEVLDSVYKGLPNKISMDIIYNPNINEFRGKKSIQLIIEHYRM